MGSGDGRSLLLLLSMTGYGEAHCQDDGLSVAVEVRAINSRFFKLSVRSGEGFTEDSGRAVRGDSRSLVSLAVTNTVIERSEACAVARQAVRTNPVIMIIRSFWFIFDLSY